MSPGDTVPRRAHTEGRVLSPRTLAARWERSTLLRPRLVSLLHLLSGTFGSALVMMGSIAIATHALGARVFGIMVVVLAIGRTCERLLRFESWQPLIRFVAKAQQEGADPSTISRLYAYGLVLDIVGALASAVLAILAAWLFGPIFGLESEHVGLVAIYACAIACNVRGSSSAALRFCGRFRTLAYIQLVSSLLRLLVAALLLMGGAGLTAFLILWTVAQILDSILFNMVGLRTLAQAGIPSPLKADRRGLMTQFPGFLRFAFSTNLSSTLRTLTHETDTLLVSAFAGPGPAGLYYLSRRIAKVAQSAGDMIQTVVYPDLARIWASVARPAIGRFVRVLQAILAAMALVGLVSVWLLGKPVIEHGFGEEFLPAWPMLMAQLVAVGAILHAAPARSAMLAMNRPGYVLATAMLSTLIFYGAALFLLPRIGAIGANFAHIAFGLLTGLVLDLGVWHALRPETGECVDDAAVSEPEGAPLP